MRVRVIGALGALAFAFASPAMAQSPPCAEAMSFEILPTGDIAAAGRICPDTDSDFRYFLRQQGRFGLDWPVTVRLASFGGNPLAAMQIGRLLRQHRMNVEIVGPCASACTYLAMGGVRRTMLPEAAVGVHRMYMRADVPTNISPDQAIAFGQQFAAAAAEYAEEMGISAGFVREALRTPSDQITVIPPNQLCRYNFLTCGEPSRSVARAEGGPLVPITFWSLNQSMMALSVSGETYQFYYHQPRYNMTQVGVAPGTLFLTGRRLGQAFEGTAYTFSRNCGALAYPVQGTFNAASTELVLTGEAPMVNAQCRVAQTEFRRIELVAASTPGQ